MKYAIDLGWALSMAACLVAGAAHAQDVAAARKCTVITSSAERLACFDAAYRVPAPLPTFGDNGQLPEEKQAKTKAEQALPKTQNAHITLSASLPRGRYRLTLDNDQVWETLEPDWTFDFKKNDAVNITRMTLGGYQIAPAGSVRSVQARRIK